MAFRSGFFNAKQNTDGSYDRTYDANDISNYLGGLISDGVVQSSADALQVSVEQASMQVQIRPGRAFLNNRWFTADSVIALPLTRAHGTLSRITAVALHFDETNREVVPVCIDGTLASSPVPPTLDKTYLLLGLVKVPANPSNLSKITVSDSRKFVHALVNYDFNQEVLQKEYIQTFNAWFEGIKNQLGTDLAGNLQNQINAIKGEQSQLLQRVYPIGSLYISESTVSPATLFGFGRWEKIEDRFLIGASRNMPIKSSGGSKTHAHGNKDGRNGNLAAAIGATNNQPNTIGYKAANDTNIGAVGGATYVVAGTSIGFGSWNHFTQVVGQTAEDGTLPPYYAVNIWRRIS
nr:MAG TPA: Receptor Binding Protein [Caudoviricetes sp.]